MMKTGSRITAFLPLLLGLILVLLAWLPGFAHSSRTSTAQSTDQRNKSYLPIISRPTVSPPLVSTSLYMYTKDRTQLVNEGCALGQRDLGLPGKQDSVVILAFGYPQRSPAGVYGTRGYGSPPNPWTIAEITAAVENFG
jgi:hypothetical protein